MQKNEISVSNGKLFNSHKLYEGKQYDAESF